MRQLFLLSIILFLIFSCRFNKQNETLDLSFSVDVNKLKEIVSSQSEASALDSNIKKKTSSAEADSDDDGDELFFFGVVLREVDGAIKDTKGRPVGKIIPGASRIINGFKNYKELEELMERGSIKMMVDVPSPSNISITVFAVFIGYDKYHHGPETWTSLFHVAGPFKIEGGEQRVHVSVSDEQVEDDHAPFVDWHAIFADASGNPVSGETLRVKHCKIGFTFEQQMFDENLEDRYLFRTDTRGRINSLIPGSGVDWEIMIGNKVIRACGASGLNGANYPSTDPKIMFTAFVGDKLYENPYDFANDSAIVPADFGIINIGTGPSDWLVDHDGDGVKTSIEISELKTNPFNDNEVIHNKYDGDLVYAEDPYINGTEVRFGYSIRKSEATGGCASGNFYRYNGAPWALLGEPWEETSDGDYANCVYNIGEGDLLSWVPTGQIKNIVIKIKTGFQKDLNGDGTLDDIILYKSFRWCNGSGCTDTPPTITSMTLQKRYKSDGPSERIEEITDYSTLFSSGCDNEFNYLLTLTGNGFKAGGRGFLSSSATCDEADIYEYVHFNDRVFFDDKFQIEMWKHDNTQAGPFYFCYKDAINSSSYTSLSSPTFSFVEDPNYSCDYGGGGNAFNNFSVGSISEGDLASQIGPNINGELYSYLGTDSYSVKLWFNSSSFNMCLSFFTYGSSYNIYASSSSIYYHNLPGTGSYNVDSIEFYSDGTCSSGFINAFDITSFNQTLEVTSSSLVSNISSGSGGPFNVSTSTYNAPDINFSLNSGLTENIQSVHLSMDAGSKNLCVDIYLSYGMTSFNLSSGGTINSTNMINDGNYYLLESIHFYPGTGCVTESFSENVSGLNFLFQTALNPSVTNLYSSSGGPYDITPSNSGPDIEVSLSASGLIEDTQSIFLSMDYGAKSMCVNVYLTSGTTLFNLNTGTISSTDMISGTNYSLDEIYFYSGPDCSMTPTFIDDVNSYNFLFQTLI